MQGHDGLLFGRLPYIADGAGPLVVVLPGISADGGDRGRRRWSSPGAGVCLR
jgi:hypothetical protein